MGGIDWFEAPVVEREDALSQLVGGMRAVQQSALEVVASLDVERSWVADGATSMTSWLVARLGMLHSDAAEWVRVARALEELPAVRARFGSGVLSFDQIRALTRLITPTEDEMWAERARGLSVAELRRIGRQRRRQESLSGEVERRRSVRWWWESDQEELRLAARLPAGDGAVLVTALTRLAEDTHDGNEPFESRCADALVGLAASTLADDADADRATVVVHVRVETLDQGDGLAEIEGGGVVPADTVERLLCDARWQVVAEHPGSGGVIGIGRMSRVVSSWLARQVRFRDGGCRFPGCGRTRWVHIHHIRHWVHGGTTDLENLVSLCSFHHRFIHQRGWRIRGSPDETGLTFVNPFGRDIDIRQEPVRPEVRQRIVEPLTNAIAK